LVKFGFVSNHPAIAQVFREAHDDAGRDKTAAQERCQYSSPVEHGRRVYALERKRKHIDAELGHRTYVVRAQFDCEYRALKECFAALGKLRLSFNGLRPPVDWLPDDEKERVKLMAQRLNDFKERYNPLVNTAASVYPFVPKDIDQQFQTCMKAALLEIRHIEEDLSKALTPDGYMQGGTQRGIFESAYFEAAKLTRQRFQRLSIVSE
jgi:hypothetical protein